MRALSLNLMKGRIDEVNQKVTLTWLQPRVLDLDQVYSLPPSSSSSLYFTPMGKTLNPLSPTVCWHSFFC